jgi:CheY-like chemotaxis protein
VELHGGSVHAYSDGKGKGATFVVKLPLAATLEPAPPEVDRVHPTVDAAARSAPASDLHGIEVLIIDDDADALDLMATVLSRQGAVVRTGAGAATGLAEFERSQPDVLLSDIEMPGEDGYTLIARIRALPPSLGGNVPAAAITAYREGAIRRLYDASSQACRSGGARGGGAESRPAGSDVKSLRRALAVDGQSRHCRQGGRA